jgi:HSP20 family protein
MVEIEGITNEEVGEPEIMLAASRAKKDAPVDAPITADDGASAESPEWPTQPEGQLTVDVYQTPNEIVIQSTIAGVKPEDLDITIANDMVSIRGKRVREDRVPEENFYYQECYWGPFARSIILPAEVKGSDAEASIKHGILTIRLPKAEKEKLKKIPVRVV